MKKLIRHISIVVLIAGFLVTSVQAAETTDYDTLFERALSEKNEQIANELANTLLADIGAFMEELAFRDAKTKQAVIDLFVGEYTASEQFVEAFECLLNYHSKRDTKSETELVAALKSAVMYAFFSTADDPKDIAALLAETMSVNDGRAESFSYDLSKATIADSATVIRLIAKEDETVKTRILLFFANEGVINPYHGSVMKEKLTAVRETEDFTEEELILLDTIVGYYADSPTVTPPSDPVPEELEAWLLEKQQQNIEPTETEPTPTETDPPPTETDPQPTQTDPTDPEPTEIPDEPEEESSDRLWLTVSLCFLACSAGVMIGVLWYNRKDK